VGLVEEPAEVRRAERLAGVVGVVEMVVLVEGPAEVRPAERLAGVAEVVRRVEVAEPVESPAEV
jgi:hypothetical protein